METYQLAMMLKAELSEDEIVFKQGLRTWRVPLRRLVGVHLYNYMQMRMLVLGWDTGGKIKTLQLPVDPFQAKVFLEKLVGMIPPEADLTALEKKEALSRLGVKDMTFLAPFAVLAVLLVLAVIPLLPTLIHGFWDTERVAADLEALYRGELPNSNYITVKGRLAEMGVTETTEYTKHGSVTSTEETDYIPFLPPSWKPGQAIKVVLEVSSHDTNAMNEKMGTEVEVSGMIRNLLWEGADGEVLEYMAKQQGSPTGDTIILALNDKPEDHRLIAYIVISVVFVIFLIVGIAMLVQSRKNA